jgi:hypothetical protein
MAGIQGSLLGSLIRCRNGFKYLLPNASFAPTCKAIIDCGIRAIFLRAILPAAANFQDMHDPAQDAMIVITLRPRLISWQVGNDLFPLLGTEPK